MATKEQERKALEQIRKIVEGLGEDSYIGVAFEGCFEIAENNIESDFFCSMKQRMETAERTVKIYGEEREGLKSRAEHLERQLERELEWKPYTDEDLFTQDRYDQLRASGHEMTDAEAAAWISGEFGFAQEKISIVRKMNTYEVNRHHMLRKTGEVDRAPYYDATDWYYVAFTVAGYDYEAYDGNFHRI